VDDGYDYPALLQQLFVQSGRPNVEVLNFGMGGYGFHQMHMMWEFVGKQYDLDYLILLPASWVRRDTSFLSPSYREQIFHARYILKDGDVELIDIIGDSLSERAEHFNRFFPHLRYLRYDRVPPAFLRALLPKGRTLKNPFYYLSQDRTKEAFDTYEVLLSRFARSKLDIIVATRGSTFIPLVERVGQKNLHIVPLTRKWSFLYAAPASHHSPWGNLLIAEQIFDVFSGNSDNCVQVVEFHDVEENRTNLDPHSFDGWSLHDADRISVHLDELPVASFYQYQPKRRVGKRVRNFNDTDTKCLLAVTFGKTVADALFIPFSRQLSEKEPIELSFRRWERNRISSKPIVPLTKTFALWKLDLCAALKEVEALDIGKRVRCRLVSKRGANSADGNKVTVLLNGEPLIIAAIAEGNKLSLFPIGRYYRIRGDGDLEPKPESLSDSGFVYLVVDKEGEELVQIPLAKWVLRDVPSKSKARLQLPR
jgi:hypothetical protein